MAQSKVVLKFIWENNNLFRMTSKEGDTNPEITIIEMHENSDIARLWKNASAITSIYLAALMTRIGSDMAKP